MILGKRGYVVTLLKAKQLKRQYLNIAKLLIDGSLLRTVCEARGIKNL